MTIKERVKELWRICFDDSEEFIDLYFRLRYSNKDNIIIQSGDDIISALQMLPYTMTYCGSQINTSYISGACTHPDYRGKGVMRELLSQAFTQMTRKSIVLSTLIPAEPWLFDYYKKMGYAPVFLNSHIKMDAGEIPASGNIKIKSGIDFDKMSFDYLNNKNQERPCTVLHDEADFKVILEDLALSGGRVFTAYEKGKITGVATIEPSDKGLRVTELIADNEEIRNALLRKSSAEYGINQMTIIAPAGTDYNARPLGMARIIYAKALLQLYAAANPAEEMNIELTDKQLSINNGYYYLVGGKCMTTKKRLPGSHLQLNISELTEKLLSPYQPYMSLMLN